MFAIADMEDICNEANKLVGKVQQLFGSELDFSNIVFSHDAEICRMEEKLPCDDKSVNDDVIDENGNDQLQFSEIGGAQNKDGMAENTGFESDNDRKNETETVYNDIDTQVVRNDGNADFESAAQFANKRSDVNEIDFQRYQRDAAVEPPKEKRPRLDLAQRKLRDKENHPMIAHECKHKQSNKEGSLRCGEIDELTLVYTHNEYWNEDYDARSAWLCHTVDIIEPKIRQKNTKNEVNRGVTRLYHLY